MRFKNPARTATVLTIGLVVIAASTYCAQLFAMPESTDSTTAKLVTEMVTRKHVSRAPIDDNVSSRLVDRYVKSLDPQKLYLLQSDVDAMNEVRSDLDDQLRAGDVQFGYATFDLYLKRMSERMEYVEKLIDMDHDFSIDEEMVLDGDDLPWAKTPEELNERWRKRIKYDLVSMVIDDTPLEEARERLHKRYRNIQQQMSQTEPFEKLETYLSALTHCFDPHSSYMSQQTLEDFQIQMKLQLEGIGAALKSEDGYTVVAQIVPGGAAEKDGRLKVGDKIIGVAQEEGEFVDVVEMKLNKVVRYIRGPKGTIVRLQVKTAESGETKVYKLTRQVIALTSSEVKGEIIDLSERAAEQKLRVGVINIPSFYRDFQGAARGTENFKSTARDVRKVLGEFHDAGGVDAIVVDLRTNGGGALSEAIEVSGLFIKDGPVVQVKDQNGQVRSHDDDDPHTYYTGPLVVLCNRLSASASEIFAGAIKDYRRGLVVGDTTTHGKGTVQNVMPVSERVFLFGGGEGRGALKLTINQFYRVNGDSTQSRGVQSDVVLPSLIDHMDLGEASLDNALAFDQIPAAPYTPLKMIDRTVISQLQDRSQQRVQADEEFNKLQEDIAEYLERKNRKSITLNQAKLAAERKKDDEDKDEDEDADQDADGPIFPDGYYNNEVLNITADYVQLFKQMRTAGK